MKLLKIDIYGLKLYKNGFSIDFYAKQRVQNTNMNSVNNLFNNIYTNNVESFIGINASGKTTALKLISFVFSLINGHSLSTDLKSKIIPLNCEIKLKVFLQIENNIILLNTTLIKKHNSDDNSESIYILSEEIKKKPVTSFVNKKNILDESDMEVAKIRNNDDEYLPNDVSIMISYTKKNKIPFSDLTAFTNLNIFLGFNDKTYFDILSLLDPTIEYFYVEKENNKDVYRLKFYNENEIKFNDSFMLEIYLSSGTIKGIRVFSEAIKILKNGGYLVIDEIENHFNQELVFSLVKLFTNKKTNPNGATLIFSTHYAELLDIIDRNDSIYITRSCDGLLVNNLCELLKRNDLKKSEIYQSNYLTGTAPKYSCINSLQKNIIKGFNK